MTDAVGASSENPIDLANDHNDTDLDKGNGQGQMVVVDPTEQVEKQISPPKTCPYLDTIDRKALDFDFEKLCSVSLSKVNVYACLVCGKYFQGRGRSTHAFIHSVSESHHVFLNLETLRFYCLPDSYEIGDSSLNDILYVLRPTFTQDDIEKLDRQTEMVQAYDGKRYYPGIVGLNNLKYNDYCNVVFQALSHVIPLRNHFLIESNYALVRRSADDRYILCQRFGELVRKLWNPRNFKAHVSPHEMLQAIVSSSKKKFEFTKQSDPIVFLGWFLNSLLGPKREKGSIIKRTFQGKILVTTRLLVPDESAPPASAIDEPQLVPADTESFDETSFLYLTLDLPSMPLFPKKDEKGKVIKPRVSIYELLEKFNGKTEHRIRTFKETSIKRYEILRLPKYLILYFKRFTQNTFFTEKNTHLVDFPINNKLDMTDLLNAESWLATGAKAKVKQRTAGHKSNDNEKSADNRNDASHEPGALAKPYNYTLITNIVHDGQPDSGKGTYRAHILHRATGKWFELQDLYVTELADTTLITLSEPYIQIWELKE